jgi:hypothetical protein
MENHSYTQIIGSPEAPYINALAGQCGLATSFFAETHPSLPNYLAMTSGSTHGVTGDANPPANVQGGPSIFSQLNGDWRVLAEDMPIPCAPFDRGSYVAHHNPAVYYSDLATQCATRDLPLRGPPDLSARFTFITPNNCHNMHSCSGVSAVREGDTWLSQFIPTLLASPQYQAGKTAIFLTWDEDDYNSTNGNDIPTLIIAPSTPPGTQSPTHYDHYAMLRTTEEMLGLPTDQLGPNVTQAPSMRNAFGL